MKIGSAFLLLYLCMRGESQLRVNPLRLWRPLDGQNNEEFDNSAIVFENNKSLRSLNHLSAVNNNNDIKRNINLNNAQRNIGNVNEIQRSGINPNDIQNNGENLNLARRIVQEKDESINNNTPTRILGPGTTEVEQLNNITFAITNFAVNLMKSVSALQSGNIIISPTSITTVLALFQQGTYGASQNEITEALQLSPEITAPTYKRLTTDMKKRVSRNILTVANHLYLADGFDINEDFKSTAVKNFGSEVTVLNMGQPAQAVRQINKWVAANTNNRIHDFLAPEAVNPNTQLVVVNAVYFKGLWENKFKPESTKPLDFYLSNGKKITVPFMRTLNNFKYGVDEELKSHITILPFERTQYSLIIILPHTSTNVNNVLYSLTNTKLVNYHKFDEAEVRLELPKFTLKTDTDLIPVLKNMGVKSLFDAQTDLSGIGSFRTFSPHISNAFHTGYMAVDEQGVSAAAASSFAAVALSYDTTTITYQVNRPFVAVLWDTQFAIPLFIARIEDPSA